MAHDKSRPEAAPDQSATTAPSIPPVADTPWQARRDEHGLLPICCTGAYLDGHIAGHGLGYRQGAEYVRASIEADVAHVVGNAVKGIDVMAARAKADSK